MKARLGMDFEALVGRKPVNKEAALSHHGGAKQEAWEGRAPEDVFGRPDPWPIKEMNPGTALNPGFRDLTGVKHGRLTYLGLSAEHKRPAKWVARCACGQYVLRRFSSALDPDLDRCQDCEHTRFLREGPRKPQPGKQP